MPLAQVPGVAILRRPGVEVEPQLLKEHAEAAHADLLPRKSALLKHFPMAQVYAAEKRKHLRRGVYAALKQRFAHGSGLLPVKVKQGIIKVKKQYRLSFCHIYLPGICFAQVLFFPAKPLERLGGVLEMHTERGLDKHVVAAADKPRQGGDKLRLCFKVAGAAAHGGGQICRHRAVGRDEVHPCARAYSPSSLCMAGESCPISRMSDSTHTCRPGRAIRESTAQRMESGLAL